MKLDIGNGKILGTKKVSQNGQISGFTEYAGQEVLVILPDGEPDVRLDTGDYLRELQNAANEQMKLAFEEYKGLRKRFEGPEQATREFMEENAPRSFQDLYGKVQRFAKGQLDEAERKVEGALGDRDRDDETPQET